MGGQAWVTCVTHSENSLEMALVLAKFLRRTKTTKRIAVIITSQMGSLETERLYNAFDDVFCLNDNLILPFHKAGKDTGTDNLLVDELRGKIFAFSLEVYDQCVFVSPNTIILENCDKLFRKTECPGIYFYGKSDNLFLFSPKRQVSQYLNEIYDQSKHNAKNSFWKNFITDSMQSWIKNNKLGETDKHNGDLFVAKFSMKTGTTIGVESFNGLPAIVQFVDTDLDDLEFVLRMKKFICDCKKIGLLERVIISSWLNMFENGISRDRQLDRQLYLTESENEIYKNEPIAIVGMSCRFPGANSLDEFWNLLYEGKEGVQLPPSFRWKKEHCIFGGSENERTTRAGFLSILVDEFDAKFFGLSPKEALFLDPQARLLHELVWEGLENSGIDPLSLRGSRTGLFTGSWMNDYKELVQTSTEKDFFRTYMGNSMGATAARLSFMLGINGPNIATESGCSSAIVAVDLAVNSLRKGETTLALAGGVNLLIHPFQSDLAEYVIAPDGRCKTFDVNANGFGRAEGCGVLVLKRLSDAIRDRDNIWAMIRGCAISQEGLSRSLGTPTVECEALAMKLALEDAGVLPDQVSFVESHGTGTILGDPMEIAAITQTYGSKRRTNPLIIGSVKTNVGHTESCSGITGIIKTVLAMKHEIIPKHLNLETINPQINLGAIPAMIPLEPIFWPKVEGVPRLAGVSSFGITGTDGHVIIQESPEVPMYHFDTGMERPLHIMKFSGKTTEALDELIGLHEHYFSKCAHEIPFADVAFTANIGRASFNHKAFILASDFEQAEKSLRGKKLTKGETIASLNEKICFLFTGQGSQYSGMAKSLYDSSPVFCMNFDFCNNLLRNQYNLFIMEALWGESNHELNRTIYSQTSIFCIEYCLLKLWESWGIRPDFVLGHSLGEFCAVVAAGIISFEDALKLVVMRSRLIEQLKTGSMLVIKANFKNVEHFIEDEKIALDIAAVNSSEQTVVAGNTANIEKLLDLCKKKSVKAVKLQATHAFHSRHMDPILEEYRKVAATIKVSSRSTSDCQYISGMDGTMLVNPTKEINANYWVRHTRNKVSFMDACQVLKELGCQNFLEIGPQPILSTFVMQNIEPTFTVNCFPSLRRKTSDWETILTSLGRLYLQGHPVDWKGFDKPYNRKKVPSLPTYPFQRKSFWVDCSDTNVFPIHPLIGYPISNASNVSIFKSNLNINSIPYLKDHCIGNRIVMPGAAFTEMCMSAGYCVANSLRDTFKKPTRPMSLENVRIEAPLELIEGKTCRLQVIVNLSSNSDNTTEEQKGFCVKVYHQKNANTEEWVLHANASFHLMASTKDFVTAWNYERIATMINQKESPLSDGFYKRTSELGLKFGDSFKSIRRHWCIEEENGNDEIVVEISIPSNHENYILHPVVIDAMLQTGILTQIRSQTEVLRVPVRIGQLIWLGNVRATGDCNVLYLHAWWKNGKCSILVVNEDLTTPVAFLSDFEVVETNVRTIESILEQQNSLLPDMWEEVWKPISGPHTNKVELSSMEPTFSNKDFSEKVESSILLGTQDWTAFNQVNKLMYLYMNNILMQLGWSPCVGDEIVLEDFCKKLEILPKYHKLITFYFSVFCDENLMEYNNNAKHWTVTNLPLKNYDLENEIQVLESTLDKDEKMRATTEFYQKLVRHLPKLLVGNESALHFLPTDQDKQECFSKIEYQRHPGKPHIHKKFSEILQHTLKKWKQNSIEDSGKILRVLEVGAGTGYTSQWCLPIIRDNWGDNFEYCFTDSIATCFPKAEKNLHQFQRNLNFSIFNINENPFQQGIPLNYFDMIIAEDVIYKTKNLKKSLENLKATLRPQGSVIFLETCSLDRGITFSLGLFEDYWKFQDYDFRPNHPCLNLSTWKHVLRETGFSYVYAKEAYFGTFGVIYAENPLSTPTNHDEVIVQNRDTIYSEIEDKIPNWMVFSTQNNAAQSIVQNVCNTLRRCDNRVTLILHESQPQHDRSSEELVKLDVILGSAENIQGIIYAIGMDDTITDQNVLSRPLLHIIKKLLTFKKPPRLYIFTKGGHGINTDSNPTTNPSAGTLFGMVKSLKNESSDMFVRYVDFECTTSCDDVMLTNEILYELALFKDSKEKERVQIAYRDGQRYEPKLKKSVMLGNQGRDV